MRQVTISLRRQPDRLDQRRHARAGRRHAAVETVLARRARHRLRGHRAGREIPARSGAAAKPCSMTMASKLIGGWYSSSLLTALGARTKLRRWRTIWRCCEALGSSVFIIAETSNAIHGQRDIPLGQIAAPGERSEWQQFGERLTAVADYRRGAGPAACLSSSSGDRRREGQEELEQFLACTGRQRRPDARYRPRGAWRDRSGGRSCDASRSASPTSIARMSAAPFRRADDAAAAASSTACSTACSPSPGDGDLDYRRDHAGAGRHRLFRLGGRSRPSRIPPIADPRTFGELGLETLATRPRRAPA